MPSRPRFVFLSFLVFVCLPSFVDLNAASESFPGNTFVECARGSEGGHFFSQVVYAPSCGAFVSWGTQTHSSPIETYETRHFIPEKESWIDAFPPGKAAKWSASPKQWPDWEICLTAGDFYTRDGISLPRPTNSFYQVCWVDSLKQLFFYVASMTFTYDPAARTWRLLFDKSDPRQPPALLLWGSLCYDPVGDRVILFGGGGVNRPDGRPHTWVFEVAKHRWRRLRLALEPPARCNSRMVYDRKNKLIVLFGGDGQDRALGDTWVFDVVKNRWERRIPARSPAPRYCHGLAYLENCGKILLVGGRVPGEGGKRRRLEREVWVYDAAENTWTPVAAEVPELKGHQWLCIEAVAGKGGSNSDEVFAFVTSKYDHSWVVYRFRYDPSAAAGRAEGFSPGVKFWKTTRLKEWYEEVSPPDRKAHEAFLKRLPANRWVEVKPPKSTKGRTWGSALFDTDRGIAMKWGGGHSGYQGTDMAFYDVGANRFTIDRTPAFTPDPFDRWARRPKGRTFFNQPWTRHMRHTCAYDRVRKVGVFTDAGGSEWYDRRFDAVVKWTWLYDVEKRRWLEPIVQPFPGGGSVSPIAVPTPKGVLVYQHDWGRTWQNSGRLFRFVGERGRPDTWGWEEIESNGPERPFQREHMTIVYDSKRDRLIFLSYDPKTKEPVMWFFSMSERRWRRNPRQGPGGISTREAVYIPEQDAILAYGPARKGDPIWTRVYLCEQNRWIPLNIPTPKFTVHEVALEYDPVHRVAVLLWPPRFEADIRPHLFRLDREALERQ